MVSNKKYRIMQEKYNNEVKDKLNWMIKYDNLQNKYIETLKKVNQDLQGLLTKKSYVKEKLEEYKWLTEQF